MRTCITLVLFAIVASIAAITPHAAGPYHPAGEDPLEKGGPMLVRDTPLKTPAQAPLAAISPPFQAGLRGVRLDPWKLQAQQADLIDRNNADEADAKDGELSELSEESFVCTAKHLVEHFVSLRTKITIIKGHLQSYARGRVSTALIVKELNALIYHLQATVRLLQTYEARRVVYEYELTAEFGVDFQFVLNDIFFSLQSIGECFRLFDLAIDGEILVALNAIALQTSAFVGALGCVVTGCLKFFVAPLRSCFKLWQGLGVDVSACSPYLSPLGFGWLIDGLF